MVTPDPRLLRARQVRPLSGLSGAHVLLMTHDDRRWFVRKIARDPASSSRLRRQMEKQVAFTELTDVVRTPRVLDCGEHDGTFFFDMEFVRGSDGITFLRRTGADGNVAFTDRVCRYLEILSAEPAVQPVGPNLFEALYGKVCEVQQKTAHLNDGSLAALFMGLERLRRATPELGATRCHGDLTLENLVIDDHGTIWLLDLLDAPFEHYWQDLAKLHQDLEGGWYLRQHAPVARYVLDYISRRTLAAADALDPRYIELHAVLLACTFVRILPYVRSSDERAFVMQRIDHFARRARDGGST